MPKKLKISLFINFNVLFISIKQHGILENLSEFIPIAMNTWNW